MKQVVLKIRGRVQGVFFRESTKRRAEELGLVGWVRNEPDGTVKIVAEGGEEDLNKLIDWCNQGGSGFAEVSEVEAGWQKATGQFRNFAVQS